MSDSTNLLSPAKAAKYINMSKAFVLDSHEISYSTIQLKRTKRILFKIQDLDAWLKVRQTRTYMLDKDNYARCFDFALAMYYRGYTTVDWGTSRKREAGQDITNWIRGQLGELTVQKFLLKNFGVNVVLDFELHEDIVPQDIIGIKTSTSIREPKLKVGIKATKFRNSYLVLSAADVEPTNRRSDAYILTRINLPDDHLMRIAKPELEKLLANQEHFTKYKDRLSNFEPIPCEVVGYSRVEELEKVDESARLSKILGSRNPEGYRYIKASGDLHYSRSDWEALVSKL